MVKTAAPIKLGTMRRNAARAEALLKLIGNANRLMILCHLLNDALTVNQLAEQLELSQSALSQHLAKLRMTGLVSNERHAQYIYYRLADANTKILIETLYRLYCKN